MSSLSLKVLLFTLASSWFSFAATAPTITTQPASKAVTLGATATFTVTASGTSPLSYQWYKSGSSISGATSSSYTTPATVTGDNGSTYTVKVSNSAGSVTSSAATLTVNLPPTITTQPANQTVNQGSSATFSVVATGSGTLTYQWSKNGSSISGATSASYTSPATGSTDNGATFTVKVSNSYGNVTSSTATLTVVTVAVAISPTTATVALGGSLGFTATVTGTSNTAVTWTCTGGSVSSAGIWTAPTTAGTYTVKATSVADTTKSASATATVPVQVVVAPAMATLNQGATQQFSATVSGSATTTVTWSCSGGTISSSGLFTAPATAGTYTVTAKSTATPQGSGTASVTVSPVGITINPSTVSLLSGGTQQFAATVTGTTNTAVTWSVTGGSSKGTITSGGLYTAPAVVGTYTVVVKSSADTTKTSSATISVYAGPVVLTPATAVVASGGTQVFTANQPVTWTTSLGTISGTSTTTTYTAASGGSNLLDGTYTVTATSKANSSLAAVSYVTVYVSGSAVINSFTANPATVHDGQPVTLNWTTTNATSLTLTATGANGVTNGQDVTQLGGITVVPQGASTYTLYASPSMNGVYAVLSVSVDMVPTVSSFTCSPATLQVGGSTQLLATFSNGTGTINQGVGAVQSGVPVTVSPSGSTNFVLTVTNPFGAQTSPTSQVLVQAPGAYLPSIPMAVNQTYPYAIPLRDGRIFFSGTRMLSMGPGYTAQVDLLTGDSINGSWESGRFVQVFDPAAGTFQQLGNAIGRCEHTATLCSDGRVLLYGGRDPEGTGAVLMAEHFDPQTGLINSFGQAGVYGHTATLLSDGRILIAGGVDSAAGFLVDPNASANPLDPPTVQPTGSLAVNRANHVALRLLDGRVMVAGGLTYDSKGNPTALTSVEIYDPTSGTWSSGGTVLHGTNPVLLADGRVVFNGMEIYDPSSGLTQELDSNFLGTAGLGLSCALLPDGRIAAGGPPWAGNSVFFDPLLNACTGVQGPFPAGDYYRGYSSITVLQDGTLLMAAQGPVQSGNNILYPETHADRLDPQAPLNILPTQGHSNVDLPVAMSVSGALAPGVTWSASGGSVQPDGTFTASAAGMYAVTATAVNGTRATAWIDVHPAVTVLAQGFNYPGYGIALNAGVPLQLGARVLYTPNQSVTWSVLEGPSGGSVTQSGVYTASGPGTFHVIATSVVDPTRSASILINTAGSVALSIVPQTISVTGGASVTLKVLEPTYETRVSVTATGGTATVDGTGTITYVAPTTPGSYTLTATSLLDSTETTAAIVTVVSDTTPAIFLKPDCLITNVGTGTLFTVSGTSAANLDANSTFDCSIAGPMEQGATTPVTFPWTASGSNLQSVLKAPTVAGTYSITIAVHGNPALSTTAIVHVMFGPSAASFSINSQYQSFVCTGMPLSFTWSTVNATQATISNPGLTGGMVTLPPSGTWTIPYDGSDDGPYAPSGYKYWVLNAVNPETEPGFNSPGPITVSTVKMVESMGAAAPTVPVYVGAPINLMSVTNLTSPVSMTYATFAGLFDTGVTWTVPNGTITGTVLQSVSGTRTDGPGLSFVNCTSYVPARPGTYTLLATANGDVSRQVSNPLTVVDIVLEISPITITLDPGQTLQFGFNCVGAGAGSLVWSATGGSITQGGFYTAPQTQGTYTVTLYSATEPWIVRTASVTVSAPVVQVTPGLAIVAFGAKQKFQALVRSGTAAWSVVETNGGTIAQDGTYTAPLVAGTYTVKAVSSVDLTSFGTAKVVVTATGGGTTAMGSNTVQGSAGVGLTLSPTTVITNAGTYFTFVATVTGTDNPAVTWAVANSPATATIDPNGVFLAKAQGLYQVVAQCVADPTLALSAQVSVLSSLGIMTSPMGAGSSGYSVTALSDGRVLVAGGLQLPQTGAATGWDGTINDVPSNQAWIYDPATGQFQATGTMITPRNNHQAVLLKDGRVLLMGGFAQWMDPWSPYVTEPPVHGQPYTVWDEQFPAAELFDPASGTFVALPVGSLTSPLNGAGHPCFASPGPTLPGQMFTTHPNGTAITMANGSVLSAGGDGSGYWGMQVQAECGTGYGPDPVDLFSPGTLGFDLNGQATWRQALGFTNEYVDGTGGYGIGFGQAPRAVNLANGQVLITCGADNDGGFGYWYEGYGLNGPTTNLPAVAKAEAILFDPVAQAVTSTANMVLPRFAHSLTVLPDGRVLAAGGKDMTTAQALPGSDGTAWAWNSTATAEIYDPVANTWTPTGNMNSQRAYHAAVLLPTGKVLIVGGYQSDLKRNSSYPNTTELFDPATGTFSVMDTLDYGLSSPQLALMNNGQVFVAGQVQAPMNPPTTSQTQANLKTANNRLMAADAAPVTTSLTIGSSLFAVGCPEDLQIDYIKQNQGVPIYIDAYQPATNSGPLPANTNHQASYPQWPWKSSVPSIANRAAQLDIYFNTGQSVSTVTTELDASLQIIPAPNTPYATQPAIMVAVSATGIPTQFEASFPLTSSMTIPGATLQFVIDPNRTVWPSTVALINTTFNINPGWTNVPPLKFRIIPIEYVDPGVVTGTVTNPDGSISNTTLDLPAPVVDQSLVDSIGNMMMDIYPISSYQYVGNLPELSYPYTVGTPTTATTSNISNRLPTSNPPINGHTYPGWFVIDKEMEVLREKDQGNCEILYAGLISNSVPQQAGNPINGLGLTGRPYAATSLLGAEVLNLSSCFTTFNIIDPTKSTMPHEIGHNYDRSHAPTPDIPGVFPAPDDPDASYPYSNGQIGVSVPGKYFDILSGSMVAIPNYSGVAYDFMGDIVPQWVSDYTFGGISMQMLNYYNLMNPGVSLAAAAVALAPSPGIAQSVPSQNERSSDVSNGENACAIIRFCYSSVDNSARLMKFSNAQAKGPVPGNADGEFVLRVYDKSDNLFETKFDMYQVMPDDKGYFEGRAVVPAPTRWIRYELLRFGQLVCSESFSSDPSAFKPLVKLVNNGNDTLGRPVYKRTEVKDWGSVRPKTTWARIKLRNGNWETIRTFDLNKPTIEIPEWILKENQHPVVEIHMFFGLVERVHAFIWNDPNLSTSEN